MSDAPQPQFYALAPVAMRLMLDQLAATLEADRWAALVARADAAYSAALCGDMGPALDLARGMGVPDALIRAQLGQLAAHHAER